jgi:hypothetical protein
MKSKKMEKAVPKNLQIETNKLVLQFLKPLSCHGDIVEPMDKILRPFADVGSFCPNGYEFKYSLYYVNNVVFAFGAGMHNITVRIPNKYHQSALEKRASNGLSIGEDWFNFTYNSLFLKEFVVAAYESAKLKNL